MDIQESAACLLLRSPHLSVSHILHLLDISDSEFRKFLTSNAQIANLVDKRRTGELKPYISQPKECKVCAEWFMPYASARHCSDECLKTSLIQET